MEQAKLKALITAAATEAEVLQLLGDAPEKLQDRFGFEPDELNALCSADLLAGLVWGYRRRTPAPATAVPLPVSARNRLPRLR